MDKSKRIWIVYQEQETSSVLVQDGPVAVFPWGDTERVMAYCRKLDKESGYTIRHVKTWLELS